MRVLFILFFVLTYASTFSQRSKLETVEIIGINQKALSANEWPFDLAFYIAGKTEPDIQSINFNYRIADATKRRKKWVSFPLPNNIKTDSDTSLDGYLSRPKQWKPGFGDNTKFLFLCDGLHPNIKYNFRFEIIRTVSLDAGLVTEMKNKIAEHLKAFFKLKESSMITVLELKQENTELKTIVLQYFPGKELKCKKNTEDQFTFDAFNTTNLAATAAYVNSKNLFTEESTYKDVVASTIIKFDQIRPQILKDIDAIQSGKLKLNSYSREVMNLSFNPGLKEFKSYTLLDGIKLLRQMSLPLNSSFKDVLVGRMKIINNGFASTEGGTDFQSILFVASLLDALGMQQVIKDTVGIKETVRFGYFSKSMKDDITTITLQIPKIVTALENLRQVNTQIPDILSQIVQFEALESEVLSVVDVLTEKTPYVSAEAGISYVNAFQSTTHYQGANIYFVPIDKRAPLNSFRGFNRFLKMFCIQVGASSYFGDRPGNSQSLLGKSSKTDLNLGLGLRLNRILKVNAGIIPYKTNKENELSDNYEISRAGYVSIGIDVNLLKAFGDVASLLKL